MTTDSIGLFKALNAKIDFLNQRHKVIAQNIANADTPGYVPQDLKDVDFGGILKKVVKSNNIIPETTNPAHMPSYQQASIDKPHAQKKTYEVAPTGNAVIMEEQMIKSGKTQMDYNLMLNLYRKNVGLIKAAIGK